MFTPNKGRLVINNGSNAQCTAQARDIVTPKASIFILSFMPGKNSNFASKLQNKYVVFKLTETREATIAHEFFVDYHGI